MKQLIKRKDGSYSQRGLWDNIRANRGSGKKPTAEMLKQERKIRKGQNGMEVQEEFAEKTLDKESTEKIHKGNFMMQMGATMPQTSAGQSVLKDALMMSKMQDGGKMPADIARARFMAAAKGNVSQAKETASKYGYKMQAGGYRPSYRIGDRGNYSGSDNTVVANNPAVMRQKIAEGQALQKQMSTEQGRIQAQQAKQRAQSNIATAQAKKAQAAAAAKAKQVADMKARIEDSKKVQDLPLTEQFTPENIQRATQATGDKLRLFGPESPLVTSGLFDVDPNSAIDTYLNPAKFIGDMATNLGQGINESYQTGNLSPVAKSLATPIVAGATMGLLKNPMHSLEHQATNVLTKNINNAAVSSALANPSLAAGIGVGAGLIGKGINQSVKAGVSAAEHDVVHRTTSPTIIAAHKNGGSIKSAYYMKNGGQFPDRYKKMGFSGVDQPKRTPNASKSHAVVTKVNGDYKLIRFGQQGVTGDRGNTKRAAAFKARHAKNIAKGKSSAAYWANKVKW